MRYLKTIVPMLLLVACGGKDPAAKVTPKEAPVVLSTVPGNGSAAVAVDMPITATFSKVMDPTTINVSTFLLKDGTNILPATVSYAERTAKLMPTAALPYNTELTVTLTVAALDHEGIALANELSWSFTTLAENAPPDVSTTVPADGDIDVWIGQQLGVSFNMPMNPATVIGSFTVTEGTEETELVPGEVSYNAETHTATFIPAEPLTASASYSATISTDAASVSGRNLLEAFSWTFTTRDASRKALPVDLGAAGNYVILAATQISTVPASIITGDIALSPAAATFITGFSLTADASNTFSTSPQITGKVFAADYAAPTSSQLTVALTDMGTAFTDAAGRAPDVTELNAGDIGGLTLAPGVYKWGSGLLIPGDVYLEGDATDVWIFQIAKNVTMASATKIFLTGGALPKNVFWQVSGLVDIGTTSHFEGIVLSQTAINLQTGASINGRLLAQSAVNIDTSTVTEPAP